MKKAVLKKETYRLFKTLLPAAFMVLIPEAFIPAETKTAINRIEYSLTAETEAEAEGQESMSVSVPFTMIEIPDQNYLLGQTEVTQALYTAVMGENPSTFSAEEGEEGLYPVDTVSWYDSIVFCNRLSIALALVPAYSVNGSTNPDDWDYEPHGAARLEGNIEWNKDADGFRLATESEWEFAAKANLNTKYAGSNNLKTVAWYRKNSGFLPHEVATKNPNAWGLYDMAGNVWEWVWDKETESRPYRLYKGGSCDSDPKLCQIKYRGKHYPMRNCQSYSYLTFGLRIARNK